MLEALKRVAPAAITALLAADVGRAAVDLGWRPETSVANVGDTVRVALVAYSDNDDVQTVGSLDALFAWDPDYLTFDGVDLAGGASWTAAWLPFEDPWLVNEQQLPADGDARFQGLGPLGTFIPATPAGAVLATFEFTAIQTTDDPTVVSLLDFGGSGGATRVFDGEEPGKIVTGSLGLTQITIVPEPGGISLIAAGVVAISFRRRGASVCA